MVGHYSEHQRLPLNMSVRDLEADSDLVCQPGARWMDINATLKQKGERDNSCKPRRELKVPLIRYPIILSGTVIRSTRRDLRIDFTYKIDPAPGATIGGMVSTGCSGSKIPSKRTE